MLGIDNKMTNLDLCEPFIKFIVLVCNAILLFFSIGLRAKTHVLITLSLVTVIIHLAFSHFLSCSLTLMIFYSSLDFIASTSFWCPSLRLSSSSLRWLIYAVRCAEMYESRWNKLQCDLLPRREDFPFT